MLCNGTILKISVCVHWWETIVNFISSVRLKLWGKYIFTTGKLFILHKVNLRARKSIDYGHLCNSWPRWFSQIISANVVFIQPVVKNSHLNHQYCGLSSNPQRVAALSVCIFAYFNRFGFFFNWKIWVTMYFTDQNKISKTF